MSGSFVWYDLMTTDTAAAEAFYHSVVGWEAVDSGVQGPPYTLFTTGGVPAAGLMSLPEEARGRGIPPCWSGYVGVDDVDADAARVAEAGGTMHRGPQDIPGVGRFAVVADPHGAVFLLFKAASAQGGTQQPDANTPGRIGWHELHAGDPAEAFGFYAGLFGWTKGEALSMGPMGTYQLFSTGDGAMGGMLARTAAEPVPYWLYYFNVADIAAAEGRVTAAGGRVVYGPVQVPGGTWILQALDGQGALFALAGPRP